ncbi:MAG: carboxypeptidase regulatory-like domain-containing protein [Candidatus Nanohaloarchaea archaeon]
MKKQTIVLLLIMAGFVAPAAGTDTVYMEPLKTSPDNPRAGDRITVEAVSFSVEPLSSMKFYVNGDKKAMKTCLYTATFPIQGIFSFGCGKTFSFTPESAGTYELKVKAAGLLGSSTRKKTVEVSGQKQVENQPPKISAIEFSPAQPLPHEEVSINVIATDSTSNAVFGIKSISVTAEGEKHTAICGQLWQAGCEKKSSFTPESSGEKTIEVTVTDLSGNTVSREKTLYVREALAAAGVEGEASNPVTFYARLGEGIDASHYECYWDDNSGVSDSDNRMNRDGRRFEAEEEFEGGEHTVYMRCFRNGAATNTVSASFSIDENEKPTARLEISPENASIDQKIKFDASESSDDQGIERYRWDFDGDGDYERTTTDSTTTKRFSTSFDGEATVQVRDSDGTTDTASTSYTVGKKSCDIRRSGLRVSDRTVDSGEEIKAWLNVTNRGKSQNLKVNFSEDGDEFYSKSKEIAGGESYNFSAGLEVTGDTEIESLIKTSGSPCGTRTYRDSVKVDADTSDSPARLKVTVEDGDGDELEDARVRVENNDTETERTDSDGEAEFELVENKYEVTVSKDGYTKEGKTVELKPGEKQSIRFQMEKTRESELTVRVFGEGRRLDDARVEIKEENIVHFTDDGKASFNLEEGSYSIQVSLEGFRTVTRTVDLEGDETVEIDLSESQDYQSSITVQAQPSTVKYGQTVMIKGFVDGAQGRSTVEISRNGETLATVSTKPDGYYQAFITPEKVGTGVVTVKTGGASSSTPLRVQATTTISEATAPSRVFEGTAFEICARAESQVTPEVRLSRNGELLETRRSLGRVCFRTEAPEPGVYTYRISSETAGETSTVSRTVKVLEVGREVESFPSKIAAVETESGIIKLDLYNTNSDLRRYDISVSGIKPSWISQSQEQVILRKGERETVYVYITGSDEGSFTPVIEVDSRGTTVFRKEVTVRIGGSKGARKTGLIEKLTGLLPF